MKIFTLYYHDYGSIEQKIVFAGWWGYYDKKYYNGMKIVKSESTRFTKNGVFWGMVVR